MLLPLATMAGVQAQDLGNPPSGEVPILFNDHTVYAKPDILKRSRVLAALVRGQQIFVPLRSMFVEMGATVSASADGRTVTAAKSGASVSVTLGKPEVIVNGETRPLDVAPILYKGVLLVPVRVLSEALGAYVQWVPGRHLVVVRYIAPASPPPAPAPALAPTPPPTAPPAPAPIPTVAATAPPTPAPYGGFVQAAYSTARNYNEFVAGSYCDTFLVSAAYAFKGSRFAVKFDYRQDAYVTSDNLTDAIGNHYTQFATIDGGTAFTPVFRARQSTLDARLEYQIAAPQVYLGLSYLHLGNNDGYPQLNAVGIGLEKLPDLRRRVTFFGSVFYYPSASGNYTVSFPKSVNVGTTYRQQYQVVQYDVGLAAMIVRPIYIYGGYGGIRSFVKANAPVGQIHDGPYLGLGVKL